MDEYECLRLENQLCFPLYVCAKEIVRRYKPFLDEIGLTYTQYIAMMVMWEHREITSKRMGEYLYLDSGTLTPVLKSLEKKGLVERARSKEDERNLILTLTKAGESLKDEAVKIPGKMFTCVNLDKESGAELYGLLHKLLESFD